MVILVLPFAFLALASGKAEGMIWLIFPVVLAAPALGLLALVFAPVEAIAAANGLSKNFLVIIAGVVGAALIWLSLLALQASAQGKPILELIATGIALRTTLIWMALGALLGCIWRASEWLARTFGWIGNA